MRIAIISDIHGNYNSLKKALNIIDSIDINEIVCLGDIIGKGNDDISCLNAIISRKITTVAGNWETYVNRNPENFIEDINDYDSFYNTYINLSEKQLNWIKNLPFEYIKVVEGKRLLFMHFLINNETDLYPFHLLRTLRNGDFQRLIKKYDYDYMFFGHNHSECIYDNATIVPALGIDSGKFLIINVSKDSITTETITI